MTQRNVIIVEYEAGNAGLLKMLMIC